LVEATPTYSLLVDGWASLNVWSEDAFWNESSQHHHRAARSQTGFDFCAMVTR
jgi:hypothetical protein